MTEPPAPAGLTAAALAGALRERAGDEDQQIRQELAPTILALEQAEAADAALWLLQELVSRAE